MEKSNKGRIYSFIAAVCCAIVGIFYWNNIIESAPIEHFWIVFWFDIVWCVVFIGLAILLFIGRKNIGFLIVSGVALSAALTVVGMNFLVFVAWIVLFVLLLLNVTPSMSKHAGKSKILYYLPACLLLIGNLIFWIRVDYFRYIDDQWMYVLMACSEIAALLFIGLWLKETRVVPAPVVRQNPYAAFDLQASASQASNILGGADKLKACKNLLDSGVITQEEFDAKKKEILGL